MKYLKYAKPVDVILMLGMVFFLSSGGPSRGMFYENDGICHRRNDCIVVRVVNDGADLVSKDDFATQKAPVPYYEIWANELNQTAQQMAAILSVLEQETDPGKVVERNIDRRISKSEKHNERLTFLLWLFAILIGWVVFETARFYCKTHRFMKRW